MGTEHSTAPPHWAHVSCVDPGLLATTTRKIGTMDSLDHRILDQLRENARAGYGDIGSVVSAFNQAIATGWTAPPAEWTKAIVSKRDENVAKMAPKLMNNKSPMDYHGALGVLKNVIKDHPEAILVNEGANTLDLARGIIDMYRYVFMGMPVYDGDLIKGVVGAVAILVFGFWYFRTAESRYGRS